jgi:hypothetical protein
MVDYTYSSNDLALLTFLQHKFYQDKYYAGHVWVWLHINGSEYGLEVGNEFGRALSPSLKDKVETQILEWVEEFEK